VLNQRNGKHSKLFAAPYTRDFHDKDVAISRYDRRYDCRRVRDGASQSGLAVSAEMRVVAGVNARSRAATGYGSRARAHTCVRASAGYAGDTWTRTCHRVSDIVDNALRHRPFIDHCCTKRERRRGRERGRGESEGRGKVGEERALGAPLFLRCREKHRHVLVATMIVEFQNRP